MIELTEVRANAPSGTGMADGQTSHSQFKKKKKKLIVKVDNLLELCRRQGMPTVVGGL